VSSLFYYRVDMSRVDGTQAEVRLYATDLNSWLKEASGQRLFDLNIL